MAEYLLYSDGDNKALRDAIFKATPKAIEQTKAIASRFKGATDEETCKNIWNFLKNEVNYVIDGEHQKVKLPSALLRERTGDCKSYSLFTASILTNLGIPWHYVLTSYNNDPTPSHIYVVCDNGVIVDAVWTAFNQEKKPNYRYKHKINDMKISYIAGLSAKSMAGCGASCSCKPCRSMNRSSVRSNKIGGTNPMISTPSRMLGTDSKFMGIGRTGYEWLKAATGREATYGEIAEYGFKNSTLGPARFLIRKFIANNGGGIANFLYNAWLRVDPITLPNGVKYGEEYKKAYDLYKPMYELLDKPAFDFTKEELSKMNVGYTPSTNATQVFNPNQKATSTGMTIKQALTPARYQAYLNYNAKRDAQVKAFNDQMNKIKAELDKKYPIQTRMVNAATEKSKQKYRDIELMWFWKLGGNPDDLNDAVKEGNTKSPRGKDANYMLNKAFNGNLGFSDIGLITRGIISAWGGDKFAIGQEGTFNIGLGLTGAEEAATIAAYSSAIIGAITGIMAILKDAGVIGVDENDAPSGDGTAPSKSTTDDGTGSGSGSEDGGDGGDNTTMMLVIGAALVGGFLILNK